MATWHVERAVTPHSGKWFSRILELEVGAWGGVLDGYEHGCRGKHYKVSSLLQAVIATKGDHLEMAISNDE